MNKILTMGLAILFSSTSAYAGDPEVKIGGGIDVQAGYAKNSLALNQKNYITGNNKHQLYNSSDPNEVITNVQHGNMRIIDISRFLNYVNILRRNKPWNTKSVSDLL